MMDPHDETSMIAKTAQVQVIDMFTPNRGKAAALNEGWKMIDAHVYLLLMQIRETARYGSQLLIPFLNGEAHMTVAQFSKQQTNTHRKMGFGLVRRFATFGVWILTGQVVTSPLSGQRAVTASLLESVGGFMEGFGVEVGLTIGAVRKGYKVTGNSRTNGASSIWSRGKGFSTPWSSTHPYLSGIVEMLERR